MEDALACLTTVESLESPTSPATLLVKLDVGRCRLTSLETCVESAWYD